VGRPRRPNSERKNPAARKNRPSGIQGREGHSQLTWSAWHNFGLEGQVGLAKDAKVLISAGDYSLGYRRPVANALMGTFVEEYCTLKASDDRFFNLDTPLDAALDQSLPAPPAKGEDVDDADTSKQIKLYAQLYLMDGNGRLLSELDDASGQPAKFSASVRWRGAVSVPKTCRIRPGWRMAAKPYSQLLCNCARCCAGRLGHHGSAGSFCPVAGLYRPNWSR